jgi:hypothetical protein
MMRTLFNRPLLMTLLMAFALLTCLFLASDGFQKRHVVLPSLAEEVKFLQNDSRRAFHEQSIDWLRQSGYEATGETWRQATGKAASSDGTGVREDLQVFVKRLSGRSLQIWGFGQPTDQFKLTQVYRAMIVSEWTQKKADEYRDIFERDAARLKNLASIGRSF